jgi:hypothetical protein
MTSQKKQTIREIKKRKSIVARVWGEGRMNEGNK